MSNNTNDKQISDDDEACSLFKKPVKPFLSGHIKFEKRGKEIVIVPMYKWRELQDTAKQDAERNLQSCQ